MPAKENAAAVVIPAFQEAGSIAAIVAACHALPGAPCVIVVDDGSTDATARLAATAGAIVVRHATNRGKGASLSAGFAAALGLGAERIATMDGDGQHRAADLPALLAAASAYPDRIVIGSRRHARAVMPPARYRANRVADFWVSWASTWRIEDSQSGMRVYPATLLRDLGCGRRFVSGFGFESEILIAAGRRGVQTIAVDIAVRYGAGLARASHFRPVLDITRIVLMVAGHLLRRGMDPLGLIRSLRMPPQTVDEAALGGTPIRAAAVPLPAAAPTPPG